MTKYSYCIIAVLLLAALLVGCGASAPAPTPTPTSDPAMDMANLLETVVDELENSRDATTSSELRAAYAEAMADYLVGGVDKDGYPINVYGTKGEGLDPADFGFDCEDAELLKKLDNNSYGGSVVTVDFIIAGDGSCTMAEHQE